MRTKPSDTEVSIDAWEKFEEFVDEMNIGDDHLDWLPWFKAFEAGFIVGLED
jgi:hypothetical protein